MQAQRHSQTCIGLGGILLGVGLIIIQAQFLGQPIFDYEFHVPQDPWALVGNTLIILSILFLIACKFR